MIQRTLNNLDVTSKTVLVRVDFNVPLNSDGSIADDSRILAHVDTVMELIEKGAKVILCSHMGKESSSLAVVAEHLKTLIPVDVTFVPDCISPQLDLLKMTLQEGEVVLLENTRKHEGEKENDPEFANALAKGVDVFINDAFAAAHRKHASTFGVAELVAEKGIGRLMEKEISTLERVLESPKKPFLVVIGGSKISTKIGVLRNLIHRSDQILVGGAMANTFLAALGHNIGTSLYEEDMVEDAREIIQDAAVAGCRLSLPKDLVIAEEIKEDIKTTVVEIADIEEGMMALDIGPETQERWTDFIERAETVLWNGPVGAFEVEAFSHGTNAVAEAIAKDRGYSILGGGDTLSAIKGTNVVEHVDYISTAGGAMLKFLEGKDLPALKVLEI